MNTDKLIFIGGRHGGTDIKEKYLTYNGQSVKWFIGDYSSDKKCWWCYASCNGKMYQLSGSIKDGSNDIENISINSDKTNHYYDEKTHSLLTQK